MTQGRKMSNKPLISIAVIAGSSFVLGVLVQLVLAAGNFWPGALAASLLIFLVGILLYFTWRAAGGERILAWMMLAAFVFRLGFGLFLAWGLPLFGYDEAPQEAGFVFEDAYRRERDAWTLAQSDQPLTAAFSDQYETDQYGGILAMSAFIYRVLSPDAFRPFLIVILAAGAMALSIPFLMFAIQKKFDRQTILWAGWILAMYPEGILLGSSQMREPFFILFFTILTWSAVHLLDRSRLKLALALFLLSIGGLFLFSFRVALPILAVVVLWIWVKESARFKKTWLKFVGWGIMLIGFLAVLLFFRDWAAAVLHWDTLQTVIRSGQIQFQLESFPEWVKLPFIIIYGIFQPVLPAAIAAPAPWIWRTLAIFRALGWYSLLPLLVYVPFRMLTSKALRKKRLILVMGIIILGWIVIASARAGGDQWDNPRYRTIFLPWMAIVAGWGARYAQKVNDRWLLRGLAVEGIFLAFFTQWYLSRYYPYFPRLDFWLMILLIVILSLAVLLGGWWRDRKRAQVALTEDRESL